MPPVAPVSGGKPFEIHLRHYLWDFPRLFRLDMCNVADFFLANHVWPQIGVWNISNAFQFFLVGGLEHVCCFSISTIIHILYNIKGITIRTDFRICQKGWNHQAVFQFRVISFPRWINSHGLSISQAADEVSTENSWLRNIRADRSNRRGYVGTWLLLLPWESNDALNPRHPVAKAVFEIFWVAYNSFVSGTDKQGKDPCRASRVFQRQTPLKDLHFGHFIKCIFQEGSPKQLVFLHFIMVLLHGNYAMGQNDATTKPMWLPWNKETFDMLHKTWMWPTKT